MISVIIPIYKGLRYIEKQIKQIENVARGNNAEIEIIFVNDDPEERLPENLNSNVKVVTLQTDKNTGIQASRIRGLSVASGEYIHFLDQDDEITQDFYVSQINCIGDADAVYCRCYNGERQTFNYDRVLETAFDRDHIFKVCPVISPGQVLIRRESIPDFWIHHILENIGSDDYFLWLCMYALGCKFRANQQILYTHVRNGDNYSSDILRTMKSDMEMTDLFLTYKMFPEAEEREIKKLPELQLVRRYAPQRKDQIVLQILSRILKYYESGNSLDKYFEREGVTKLAIYGAAVLGERIKGLLKETSVKVVCFIDKNAPFIEEDIPVVQWEECRCDFDAVLISLIENEESIENMIKSGKSVRVFNIRKIVRELFGEH